MLTLRDIMTPDPVTLAPDTSIRDAVELLRSRGISGAPVVAGTQVVGVVSNSDFLDFTSAQGVKQTQPGPAEEAPDYWADVEDWTPPPEDEEDPSTFFRELWPDSEESVTERWENSESENWDVFQDHAVSEIMTTNLCVLPPDASATDAAAFMLQRSIHRVLVMEGPVLVGIVSTVDLVKAFSEGRL